MPGQSKPRYLLLLPVLVSIAVTATLLLVDSMVPSAPSSSWSENDQAVRQGERAPLDVVSPRREVPGIAKDRSSEGESPARREQREEPEADPMWTVRGRFVLQDRDSELGRLVENDELEVEIAYHTGGEKVQVVMGLSSDGAFQCEEFVEIGAWQPDGDRANTGSWKLSLSFHRQMVWSRSGSPDRAGTDVLDFGQITISAADLFNDMVVFCGVLEHAVGGLFTFGRGASLMLGVRDGEDTNPDIDSDSQSDDLELDRVFELATDLDGRFAVVVTGEEAQLWQSTPPNIACVGCIGDIGTDMLLDVAVAAGSTVVLGRPHVRGRVVDYGRIVLGGEMIRIEPRVEGVTVSSDASNQFIPMLGLQAVPELSVELNFWARTGQQVHLLPAPVVSHLWLPEGRYNFTSCVRWTGRGRWTSHQGTIDLHADEVARLEIDHRRLEVIPAKFEFVGGKPPSELRWSCTVEADGISLFEGGGVATSDDWTAFVPVASGHLTTVSAGVTGYWGVSVDVQYGTESVLVTLKFRGAQVVEVVLPELSQPAASVITSRHIEVFRRSSSGRLNRAYFNQESTGPNSRTIVTHEAGDYVAWLTGGEVLGFRDGMLTEPVEFAVSLSASDGTVQDGGQPNLIVQLPPLHPLPWENHADQLVSGVTCGGRSIRMAPQDSLIFDTLVANSSRTTWWETGERLEFRPSAPVAIRDGSDQVELKLHEPDAPGGNARLGADLPPRLEVHVYAGGKSVDEVRVIAKSSQFSCTADTVEGVALLWMPPGTAQVGIELDGGAHSRWVDVTRERAVVVFDVGVRVPVTFEFTEDGSRELAESLYEVVPAWVIYRIDSEVEVAVATLEESGTFSLTPGGHVAIAGYGSERTRVAFQVTAGGPVTVELPELGPYEVGEVRLVFDPDKYPGDQDFSAFYCASTVSAKRIDVEVRRLPNGVAVRGLPLGVVVTLNVYSEYDGDLELKPMVLVASREIQFIPVEWRPVVQLGESWDGLDVRMTAGEGLPPMPVIGCILAGRHEIVIYHGGREVLRAMIDVPEDSEDSLPLPQDIRSRLIELGLLRPTTD